MSDVREIVSDALSKLGVVSVDAALSDEDAAVGLRELKRMVGTWANAPLLMYDATTGTFATVAGTASYSTTGLSAGRPVTVQNVYLTSGGIDYPCDPMSEQEYDDTAYKAATGLPDRYYFSTSYPNGAFYFYPTPDQVYTVTVKGRYRVLTAAATLSTSVSMPDGYEDALVNCLAVACAPHFRVGVTAELAAAARASRSWLKATNYQPLEMSIPFTGDRYVPDYLRIVGDT